VRTDCSERYKPAVTVPDASPSHPLPAGMRDLLPEEAGRRRALARRVLDHAALWGYELVTPPAFEFASVLERGLGVLDPSDVLRFVEPESGEVAALRPDVTPQMARIVATRLARGPRPIRLSYEGAVVRRRQGRARRHRQIAQVGVELCGLGGRDGDLEVLEVAAGSARAAGLDRFVIDLGHAAIARPLIQALPSAIRGGVADALEKKDGAAIEGLIGGAAAVPVDVARALIELPELEGGAADVDALARRARELLAKTPASSAVDEIVDLFHAASRRAELGERLRLDLGGVRNLAYYTGLIFQVLAPGAGEAIGGGGRYDDLLARFDAPMPAVGFALSLDAVERALEAAGRVEPSPPRVIVTLGDPGARVFADLVRAAGITAVVWQGGPFYGLTQAKAARFTHVVGGAGALFSQTMDGTIVDLGADPEAAAHAFVTRCRESQEAR
jgi:ATP phosphoribosyltransferase regulatory subunit